MELFEDWNKKNMRDIEKAIKKEFKWNRIAVVCCILGICLCIFSLTTHVLSIKHIQEKLDTHIENDTICCHYGMIQVNGVWYDEDDYSQIDWQSYTDTIQP